ncbi:shikimate dehydrogenase [Flavobacteriaceae bacterium Ap0902]|nr:shikimate dehydrogenase [Flavobacteriaceae bacterium Ap0902]
MNTKINSSTKRYGLIGKNIAYSFSPNYFAKKFKNLRIIAAYDIFDLDKIAAIEKVFKIEHLNGLNVTIPYKEKVIPYLDNLSNPAKEIGAVNTIQFENGLKIGHNTDYIGFMDSIKPLLTPHHKKALILGTGGANKAVQYALKQLDLDCAVVSRTKDKADYTYNDLDKNIISEHQVIINTTPVGTHPDIQDMPNLPTQHLNSNHLVYDLIYNPEITALLKAAKEKKAKIKNGLEMLVLQAEAAWEIWNKQ